MPRSQYWYGVALEWGRHGLAKDEATAAEWYRRAMEGGEIDALVAYASLLLSGKGVPKDPMKALELVKAEVARDEPAALIMLGRMLRFGDGVEKDEAEALKQFKRAAELGSPEAQFEVGAAYLSPAVSRATRWKRAAGSMPPHATAISRRSACTAICIGPVAAFRRTSSRRINGSPSRSTPPAANRDRPTTHAPLSPRT
jgi:TPR repeat protein